MKFYTKIMLAILIYEYVFWSLLVIAFLGWWLAGLLAAGVGLYKLCENRIPQNIQVRMPLVFTCIVVFVVGLILTDHWLPLGPEKGMFQNFIMIAAMINSLYSLTSDISSLISQ